MSTQITTCEGDGKTVTLAVPNGTPKLTYAGGANTGGSGGGAGTDDTYVVLSASATLANERILTAGTNITIADAGAGSTVTISQTDVGFAVASSSIANGVASGSVTFAVAQADDTWKLDTLYVENDTDAAPLCIVASITSKSATGFTYALNGNTDSANYVLVYRLAGLGGSSATIDNDARILAWLGN